MLNLRQKYTKEAMPAMRKKFEYKNNLAIPKIVKVIINTGVGRFLKDNKTQELIAKDLAIIAGQKPIFTLAKKAISGFKIREKMVVGLKITLRRKRMYEFLDRFVGVAIPRIRDFRGFPEKSIDREGNMTIGIKEHIIFPEFAHDDIKFIFGLEVTVVTNAKTREEAVELLRLLGFPIKAT